MYFKILHRFVAQPLYNTGPEFSDIFLWQAPKDRVVLKRYDYPHKVIDFLMLDWKCI